MTGGNEDLQTIRLEILKRLSTRERQQRNVRSMLKHYLLLDEQLQQSRRPRSISMNSEQLNGSANDQLARMKEEMANVYRLKSKNDQDLIDANRKLTDSEARFNLVQSQRDKLRKEVDEMTEKMRVLEEELADLKEKNLAISTERIALVATCTYLTEKKTQLENERFQMLNKIRELQEKSAELMNAEITLQEERAQLRIREQIARATADLNLGDERASATFGTSPDTDEFMMTDVLPSEVKFKMTVHDGEVNDVEWMSDDMFATAGSDAKVCIWRVSPNKTDATKVSTLTGCLGSANRLDYDNQRHVVLASSSDHTCRLWNVDSQRLLSTFSGHTDKVSSARLFQTHNVISGSTDRTIKQWDISSIRCLRSYLVGSTVFDIVARCGVSQSSFISSHFDKKVRFWDARSSDPTYSLELGQKVSSLDVSLDGLQILASSRDDTLSVIDVRNYGIIHLYSAEQYKTSCDTTRAIFSSTGEYVLAGSSNSSVYIWNTKTTKLEKVVKTAREDAHQIMSLSWNPSGRGLLACDRQKTCTLWR
uniref:WD_REPEATS_REGION domain-containing protein n=1 Tax=Caenorhabditis tropicalis TaxID=1561998 RepID=A0A1I7TTB9_9PELO